MKLDINHTHRWGAQLQDIPQDVIARCPHIGHGMYPEDILKLDTVPDEVKAAISNLGWNHERKHPWLYVRPQRCSVHGADTRTGSFYHLDVDAVHRAVAPAWGEFQAITVSFGDIAETEFIADPMAIDVPSDVPSSRDYVTLSPILNPAGVRWSTHSAKNAQVAHYSTMDAHRSGPIRRDGWRLILLGFATDSEKWP